MEFREELHGNSWTGISGIFTTWCLTQFQEEFEENSNKYLNKILKEKYEAIPYVILY